MGKGKRKDDEAQYEAELLSAASEILLEHGKDADISIVEAVKIAKKRLADDRSRREEESRLVDEGTRDFFIHQREYFERIIDQNDRIIDLLEKMARTE